MTTVLKALLALGILAILFGGAFLCIKTGVGFMPYMTMCMGGVMMAALASVAIDHMEVKA